MDLRRWLSGAVLGFILLATCPIGLADIPASFDLRDVDGQQYVSTRIDDQVGPGPCWAFATMTAVESSVRMQGLWDGTANDLDLSEQYLRANETTGTTWPTRSPGFNRRVNSGGNQAIAVSHMARLHGPLYESQCPFEYKGDFSDNFGYYDGTITTPSGNEYADPTTANWPHARPYPATYTSDLAGAYFLRKSYDVSGIDAIKQKVATVGTPYVSIHHKFAAFDETTNTYYDDGTVTGEGLGAHGVNIIGWDDNKVVPGASNTGAWLIKQSHEVDDQDMLYPGYAGKAPTYFWVSYETDTSRFTDQGAVTFFEMGSKDDIQSVYFHDYTGNLNSSVYLPDNASASGIAERSVCAQVFQTGPEGDQIGIVSFFTRNDSQPFDLKIFDNLADLQAGEDPLAGLTGIADVAGYHTVDLAEAVNIGPNDDFVVLLDFTDGADQVMAYSRDGTGYTGSIEMIENNWCFYYDTIDEQWEDLADHWDGSAFTVKAYGVPEPATLSLLAIGAMGVLRRRRR